MAYLLTRSEAYVLMCIYLIMEKKMKQVGRLLLIFLCSISYSHAEIVGEEVEYLAGGVLLKGFLAYENSNITKRPGILVVHEWWGQIGRAHV